MEILKLRKLNKGRKFVLRESKLSLVNFINNERFEVNYYLTYLFQQFYDNALDQSDNKILKQKV